MVRLNLSQLAEFARFFQASSEIKPFNFTGENFPKVGESGALEFFFAVTFQQYGFWHSDDKGYTEPFYGKLDSRSLKGSDFLFYAYLRALKNSPDFFSVKTQASLTKEDLAKVLSDDDGECNLPLLDWYLRDAVNYGKSMIANDLTPKKIINTVNSSKNPLQDFLKNLDKISGYCEDPLRKKSMLLAIILNDRPEKFLCFGANEHAEPIIDYHLMRSCLRVGFLEIEDLDLREKLQNRLWVSAEEENEVRTKAYEAIRKLRDMSGLSISALDWFFFNFRKICPEMTEPQCPSCQLNSICAKRKELFQPVFRTTAY